MLPVRNYGLDLLRILLCVTVIFCHYSEGWNCGGSVAVDGFFILSGFLAVCSTRGYPHENIREYYRKKCWRLLPVLLIAWVAVLTFRFIDGRLTNIWPGSSMLLETPTRAMAKMIGVGSAWFLLCIFVFFALFPFLRLCYGRKLFMWIFVISFLFATFRSSLYPFAVGVSGGLYYQVTFRLWQFLLGMWCASWNVGQWKFSWRCFWIGTGVVLLLASSAVSREGIGYLNYSFPGYLVTSSLFALCIASLWSVHLPSLSKKTLKWIGIGSGMTYSLFLFHMQVMQGMAEILGKQLQKYVGVNCCEDYPVLFCGIVLGVLLIVSYFIYQYVEVRWVGKMLKKKSAD